MAAVLSWAAGVGVATAPVLVPVPPVVPVEPVLPAAGVGVAVGVSIEHAEAVVAVIGQRFPRRVVVGDVL